MNANDKKRPDDKPQGRIGAHEEEKRLEAHKTAMISEHSVGAGAAAGVPPVDEAAAAADAAPVVTRVSSVPIVAKVIGVLCVAALIGLISIFVYKGTIGDDDTPAYAAQQHTQKTGSVKGAGIVDKMSGVSPIAAQAFATQRPVIVYLFNSDSQGVAERAALNQLAKAVSGTNDIVLIDAYTDPSGSSAYNQALSQRRADAMAQYLQQHGVPRSHIKAVGHGETSKYATPELCRRAEISVK